jgi:NitT/TauT family transport system ATP-binding protein
VKLLTSVAPPPGREVRRVRHWPAIRPTSRTAPGPGSRPDPELAVPAVELRHVGKVFATGNGAITALDDVSLAVAPGEFLCIVGASGCGKTTLLNVVAGLEPQTHGQVERRGDASFMFQEAALFPWLTVARNVELPLRLAGVPAAARGARVRELLDLVRLTAFADRQPHELSGGMRQRAALARALAKDAEVLLMDEPFGALDAMTRDVLHDELERIWRATGVTILFVTHNVREAARLGDRIVLLTSRPGRVAETFPVRIARPRRIEDPDVAALAGQVTTRLRLEVARHGS